MQPGNDIDNPLTAKYGWKTIPNPILLEFIWPERLQKPRGWILDFSIPTTTIAGISSLRNTVKHSAIDTVSGAVGRDYTVPTPCIRCRLQSKLVPTPASVVDYSLSLKRQSNWVCCYCRMGFGIVFRNGTPYSRTNFDPPRVRSALYLAICDFPSFIASSIAAFCSSNYFFFRSFKALSRFVCFRDFEPGMHHQPRLKSDLVILLRPLFIGIGRTSSK